MALHRDSFWIGRQWAVTGHGMQLIDQRLMGDFDIEVAQLWDEDLIARMHARTWLNAGDFDTGLTVARSRHQRPAPETAGETPAPLPPEPIVVPPPPPPAEQAAIEIPNDMPPGVLADAQEHRAPSPVPVEPPAPRPPDLQMKTDGRGRFASPWRVWMKRKT